MLMIHNKNRDLHYRNSIKLFLKIYKSNLLKGYDDSWDDVTIKDKIRLSKG